MHSLSKHFDENPQEDSYIDYICKVIKLYARMCQSANKEAIRLVQKTGLTESHISLVIHPDTEKLVISEKFKEAYLFLATCMYIENDNISSTISNKNRCYVWDRIKKGNDYEVNEDDNNFDDLIVNDEYAGKTKKKIRQQDDPGNAMIVLTAE